MQVVVVVKTINLVYQEPVVLVVVVLEANMV
jgi:hypothetical protein